MWLAASSSWLTTGLSVFLVGWAIKLMDDYVDREVDIVLGSPNLSRALSDGLPIYLALTVALAVYSEPTTGLTLFLAAYLVGMAGEAGVSYAGGWRAWVEILAAAVLGCMIAPRQFMLNLVLVVTIQLGDDLLDRRADQLAGKRSLPILFGPRLSLLILVTLVLTALAMAPGYSAWVIISASVIGILAERVGSP